jgi:hypothetical protein
MNIRTPGEFGVLDATLEGLCAQTLPADRYEILVIVDPNVQPRLAAHLASRHPRVRVIEAPDTHYYAMKNLGARLAAGAVVGYVDADCTPAPTWAAGVLAAFERNGPAMAAAQGTYSTHTVESSACAQAFLLSIFGNQVGRRERRICSIAASNCAFRRQDILAEQWIERPYFHGPDVVMASAIRHARRHVVLVPEAAVSHDHEPGLPAQHGRALYWGYSFLRLRCEEGRDVKYARLFRALGPLAPLVLVPAKAWIDLRRLVQRRGDLGLGLAASARCGASLLLNACSAGMGGLRYTLGMSKPREAQVTTFGRPVKTRAARPMVRVD